MADSLEGIEVRISLELTGSFETPFAFSPQTVTVGSDKEIRQSFSSRILSDTDGDGTSEPVQGPNGLFEGWLTVDISSDNVFAEFSGNAQPTGIKIKIEHLALKGWAPGTVQQVGAINGVSTVDAPTYAAATKILTLDWSLLGFQPDTLISQTVFFDDMLEDAPVAGDDNFAVNVGQALSNANILDNDSDTDNHRSFGVVDILFVTHVNGEVLDPDNWVDLSTGGQVKLASTGELQFREGDDFSDLARSVTRTTSFEYTVTDSTGNTDVGTVNIAVTGVNDGPTALSLSAQSINQSAVTNAVVGNLSSVDVDSTDFTYTFVSGNGDANNGLFNISGNELRANDPSSLGAGTYSVRIRTQDDSGLTFDAPFTINVTDDINPTAPVLALAAASDTGASNSDGIINISMPTFSGVSEANAILVLYADDVEIGRGSAGDTGAWTVTATTALPDGKHEITATAEDAAGNVSVMSSGVEIDIDTTLPTAPTIVSANLTNSLAPIISGTAEAGASITLTVGGATYVTVATGQNWGIDLSSATPVGGVLNLDVNGTNDVAVTAQDLAGNLSTAGIQTLKLDTTAPAIASVAASADGTYKAGDTLQFTVSADEDITISGSPQLSLLLDTGGTIQARYVSGSGSQSLVFAVTLTAGLEDTDGIAITGLELNGGTLRDEAGNALDLALNNVANTTGILVDSIVHGGSDPAPETPTAVDVGGENGPIVAGPGPESFQGTDSTDAVTFSGGRSGYAIERNDDGSFTVTGAGAPDTINSIERLHFDDGVLALDTDASPGLAFRLYQAAFDRAPDPAGLGYWIALLDKGEIEPLQMAAHFIQSPEFTKLYGDYRSMATDSFVSLLYHNVLGREPDAEGFEYWQQAIAQGNSYDWLLSLFSDSQENKDLIADFIADGIWYEV